MWPILATCVNYEIWTTIGFLCREVHSTSVRKHGTRQLQSGQIGNEIYKNFFGPSKPERLGSSEDFYEVHATKFAIKSF